MTKLVLFLVLIFISCGTSKPRSNFRNYTDGVCMFFEFHPMLFQFVKMNKRVKSNDELIKELQYRSSVYLSPPYKGYINNRIFEANFMDTLSYGINDDGDNRLIKMYYCNCRLYSKEFSNIDMDSLFFDFSSFPVASKYKYTYKGKPIRFYSEGYYLKLDSIQLDGRTYLAF